MSGNVTLAFPGFSGFFKDYDTRVADSPPPSSDTLRAPHHRPTSRLSLRHRLHQQLHPLPASRRRQR